MRIGSVEFEKQGRVAIVTLDEPAKLNAISMGIREGVIESLARIQADDEIRVGILTGRGDKAFCAGADISTFPATPEQARSFIADVLPVLEAPERCRRPLIAAVNGVAFGGGLRTRDCLTHPGLGAGPLRRARDPARLTAGLCACCGCTTSSAAPRPRS